jgi:hypothetical protein
VFFTAEGKTMALGDRTLVPGESRVPVGSGVPSRSGGVRRYFFVAVASTITVIVFAGFAPSFYLRDAFNPDKRLSILLHMHGFALSAWIVLFLVQTVLIARGSPAVHRRLGWVMAGLAASIVVLMGAAIVEQMRRVPPEPPPPIALALGGFDIIVFAILVSSAVYFRKRSEWHKRLMLSATILLMGAPMVRIVVLFGVDELWKIMLLSPLLADLFFVPCFIYDLLTRGKIHPAYPVGLGLILIDQVAQPIVLAWPAWINFANTIQRLVT